MTAVLNIVFAAIAGVAILGALYYGGRAVIRRGQSTESAYNVGRLEARRSVQVDLVRALVAIVIALIFLGAFGLTPRPVEPLISPTEPVLLEATDTPAATMAPTDLPAPEQVTPTVELVEETAVPTSPPTNQPTAVPTVTSEPVVDTAVVSSGVGVWLRATPSTTGEQLEWLLDGTVLTLLDGQETADGLLWQQVQTQTGVIGWVAADFILVSE
ncbi:SH3 domain-containing protein [Candidatus Leptofilum sp.]|uniref:SH3 domain-containing protein n=1 Tax=Candidatus Leptofilum sp. TaxID=3241576 RepID=UPI003B5B8EA4